jgi:hypothetical protein
LIWINTFSLSGSGGKEAIPTFSGICVCKNVESVADCFRSAQADGRNSALRHRQCGSSKYAGGPRMEAALRLLLRCAKALKPFQMRDESVHHAAG